MIDAAANARVGLRLEEMQRLKRGGFPLIAAAILSTMLAACVNPVGRSLYQPARLATTPT